jgi:hypothetical protein
MYFETINHFYMIIRTSQEKKSKKVKIFQNIATYLVKGIVAVRRVAHISRGSIPITLYMAWSRATKPFLIHYIWWLMNGIREFSE